eukprot:PhF_6_TR4873/c0_g1_i5/m.6854/K00913/ITPK1; inositol-1,3,4-trisphosphate 5/6-kinase / inositol-tetrakisphosphate 1-kinase
MSLTIVLCGHKKKVRQFFLPFANFVNSLQDPRYCAVVLDLSSDRDSLVPVETMPLSTTSKTVVFHKVFEQDEDGDVLRRLLHEYIHTNKPNIICEVLALEKYAPFLNRVSMHDVLSRCIGPSSSVRVPRTTWAVEDVQDIVFPVMSKTVQACGSKQSHEMTLYWSREQLVQRRSSLTTPSTECILQSVVFHKCFLKVYSMGLDSFHVVPRKPVPFETYDRSQVLVLDSQDKALFKEPYTNPSGSPFELSSQHKQQILCFLREVADGFHSAVLGVDLLVVSDEKNSSSGRLGEDYVGDEELFVVDVNFAPTYDGVPNAYHLVLDEIKRLASVSHS